MLRLEGDLLHVTLPDGKTQAELLDILKDELAVIEAQLYGKDVKINGRTTTAMCLYLGHRLAHVCKTVSIFDPKENTYVKAVWH